jgi:hypothetical protein
MIVPRHEQFLFFLRRYACFIALRYHLSFEKLLQIHILHPRRHNPRHLRFRVEIIVYFNEVFPEFATFWIRSI